tara:strand:- start:266 stop:2164 length:1899 start_codon:yes stop_codon:yes gene_type:complete
MVKNIFRSNLLVIFFFIFSCEELEEDTKCLDAQAQVLSAITNFTQDQSGGSCILLKTAAQDFISNGCTDTTGFGGLDPSFIADSLDCDLITCGLPIAQILQYSITMELSSDLDSSSYCAYFDSTIIAMETVIANGCEIDGAPAITQAELDSVKAIGCNWVNIEVLCTNPIEDLENYLNMMEDPAELDSISYCSYYDSTVILMENIIANECEVDGVPAIIQSELDSVKAIGCEWLQEITFLTATFHEEYDPSVKSFIFITDSEGSVLADTGFYNTGDDSFVLKKSYPKNETIPEKIGVTTVTYEPEYDEYGVSTNLGVDIGSDFHFYNPYIDSEVIGQSSYSFINIPSSYYKIMVHSKGNYLRFATDSESDEYNLDHYYDNEDVLVMLFYDDGTAGYLVVENVQIGSSHVIDLSTLQTAEHSVINNNTGMDNDYLSAYGYNDGESYISHNRNGRLVPGYGLNRMWNDDGNFIINYPSLNVTPNFKVDAYVGSSYQEPGGKNYRQTTTGSLPSSIEKIDADFDVISSDFGNFEISHSGSFDQWSVSLEDTSINAYWTVYNNSSSSTMVLPSIPASVSDEYSALINPSFSLQNIRLTDWMCAESYKEWIELFHSSNGYYLDYCSGLRDLTYWPSE